MHRERLSYAVIKQWVLEIYYDGCRDFALNRGRPHEEVMGFVTYQFENSFERPIENLMLNVVQLVLSGGWRPESAAYIRQQIVDQLADHGLDHLLADVPSEEAKLFLSDLSTLKLI